MKLEERTVDNLEEKKKLKFSENKPSPGGAIWHIGMSGALYAADLGSIPDENNDLFSEI